MGIMGDYFGDMGLMREIAEEGREPDGCPPHDAYVQEDTLSLSDCYPSYPEVAEDWDQNSESVDEYFARTGDYPF